MQCGSSLLCYVFHYWMAKALILQTLQRFVGGIIRKLSLSLNDFNAMPFQFRYAVKQDAELVAQLVNRGYRGDTSRTGWTTEADLLIGTRIDAEGVRLLLEADDAFILLCLQEQVIIGCVHCEKTQDAAYFGMFVVQPDLQGGGIGKQIIHEAEQRAQSLWGVKKMWMTVITLREELIAYYVRRGYQRTGRLRPFPAEIGEEFRLIQDLQFEELEKNIDGFAVVIT